MIAIHRAHRDFALTAGLDVFEAVASIVAFGSGLYLAGFWGLLGAVGVVILAKIAYLHALHPLRFGWAWDPREVARLMGVGLPILANTAAFGAVLGLDRALILWRVPDGDRAARALLDRPDGDELEPRPGRPGGGRPLHLLPVDPGGGPATPPRSPARPSGPPRGWPPRSPPGPPWPT